MLVNGLLSEREREREKKNKWSMHSFSALWCQKAYISWNVRLDCVFYFCPLQRDGQSSISSGWVFDVFNALFQSTYFGDGGTVLVGRRSK